jgi:hypothetical protein
MTKEMPAAFERYVTSPGQDHSGNAMTDHDASRYWTSDSGGAEQQLRAPAARLVPLDGLS